MFYSLSKHLRKTHSTSICTSYHLWIKIFLLNSTASNFRFKKKNGTTLTLELWLSMSILANSYSIFQISHAKTFKMTHTRCLYNNPIQKYSWKCWKIRFHIFISFCQFCQLAKNPEMGKFVFYIIAFDPIKI